MINPRITSGSNTMTHFEVLASDTAFPKREMLLEVPGLPRLEQTADLFPQTKGISNMAPLVFFSDYKNKY